MNIFDEKNYKTLIKQLVKEIAETRPAINLKFLAEKIPLQYTYLSKCLNDDSSHLNEDHLYKICHVLGLDKLSIEYIMLLRTKATSTSEERLAYIDNKIKHIRTEHYMKANPLRGTHVEMPAELKYLLDPFAMIVHMALDIPDFAEQPLRICGKLALTEERLEQILVLLEKNDLIERSKDSKSVTQVKRNHFHITTDHPLSGVNHSLLKDQSHAHFVKTERKHKQSLAVTFSSDPKIVQQVQDEFNLFIQKVENIATKAKPKNLYQLNFEFFRWF